MGWVGLLWSDPNLCGIKKQQQTNKKQQQQWFEQILRLKINIITVCGYIQNEVIFRIDTWV